MAHTEAQLLNYLKRASYGWSKLLLLGMNTPCSVGGGLDLSKSKLRIWAFCAS